jgi:hypothetical protein
MIKTCLNKRIDGKGMENKVITKKLQNRAGQTEKEKM